MDPTPTTNDNGVGEFPLELWIKVASSLEPHDVLCLEQTSRAMREMISTRDVWISVLRSTSRKNALFMPSFPVDEMELQEIKRAALGAYRWKRMTAGEMNHLTPKSTTSIGEEYNPFIRQFLVPGGRFLFVINRGILVLWDLGPPGRPPLTSPLMIASVKLEAQPRKRTRITVTSSGSDRLRVAVLSENGVNASMDSVDVVKIYDVCPVADEPAFIELGSLELLGAPPPEEALESSWEFRLRMHNDRLLIQVCGTLIVWDFAEGTYTSWCTAHKDSPKTHLPPVIFTGDMVLGFVSTKVVGWSVPHLTNSVPERIRLARVVSTRVPATLSFGGTVTTLQVPITFAFSRDHGTPMDPPPFITSHQIPFPSEISSNTDLVWALPSGWCAPQFPLVVDAVAVDPKGDGQEGPSFTMAVSQCQLDVAYCSSTIQGQLTLLDRFQLQTDDHYWTLDRVFGDYSCKSSNLLCQAIENRGIWAVLAYAFRAGAHSVAWLFTDPKCCLGYSLCSHTGRSVHSILGRPRSEISGRSLEYVVSDYLSEKPEPGVAM